MTVPPEPAPVLLHREQVDELRRLLGTVEDWLLHAGDEARNDLGEFLAGLSWSTQSPEWLVTTLTDELGDHTVLLRQALTPAVDVDDRRTVDHCTHNNRAGEAS